MTIKQNKDLLELEVNGQVGATGAVGRKEGEGGREEGREAVQWGERGLVEVTNCWTLWCWRTWQGSAVRHLGAGRGTAGGQTDTGRPKEKKRCYITGSCIMQGHFHN